MGTHHGGGLWGNIGQQEVSGGRVEKSEEQR